MSINNSRILAFKIANILTEDDFKNISAAEGTTSGTMQFTGGYGMGARDADPDVRADRS